MRGILRKEMQRKARLFDIGWSLLILSGSLKKGKGGGRAYIWERAAWSNGMEAHRPSGRGMLSRLKNTTEASVHVGSGVNTGKSRR